MKKIVIIVGLISALAATILATTKFSNFSIIPIIIAFISGLILLFLSKKEQSKIKPIQYIFLLVIISLGLTIYKSVNTTSEIEETEPLEQTDQEIQDKPKAIIDSAIIDEKI
ncbi:FUSC family protein [Winogradskyella schleiferi]|uniref:FUSC family protein n=1 Tax=Winogradskyella schleiferi TaxID=2686078 RepID=UPI0015B99811|nr:FUSC family protein [Winogradskyella schleiferi]